MLICHDDIQTYLGFGVGLQGESTFTVRPEWATGRPLLCVVYANGVSMHSETVSITIPAPTPAPTISVTYSTPVTAGESFTASWTSTNATSVSYSCSADGSGFNGSGNVAINGNETRVAQTAWIDYPSTCIWTATGTGGTATTTKTLETDSGLLPTLKITRNPNPLIAGRSFTTTWSSSKATSLAYSCQADANGFKGSGTLPINGSEEKTALTDWISSPSLCTWTVTGSGGVREIKETVTTVDSSVMTVVLNANVRHVRVPQGQMASIALNGFGSYPAGEVQKLELLQNNGNSTTTIKTVNGNNTKLLFSHIANLNVGSYSLKLIATNQLGNRVESAPVVINIIDSPLLGEASGIRNNSSGKLEFFGWACQDTNTQVLNYKVYADAPSILGGEQIASGVANIATENNQSDVENKCHTPGVGHHFVADLSDLSNPYQGKRLFVEVATSGNALKATLPCADNNCTMPGAIRIGLTTPQNNDSYTGPAIVFMRAKIDNGNGIYDELAFNINGEWINATPDSEPGTYTAMKVGVPSRATPYPVVAKVRQGNTTIYSGENLIYVDAINAQVSVTITAPANNQNVNLGTTVNVLASANLKQGSVAQIQTVKFKINGTLVANQIDMGSGNWKVNWTPTQSGVATIIAQAFDSNGGLLGESPAVRVNVGTNQGPPSEDLLPVELLVLYIDNPDAGTLPGNLSVTPNGAATYSIPLEVPPGTAGMQPKISLDYNSQAGNGMLGMGWSLGGFSTIHRCSKTIAQDGFMGRISIDKADRLCLNDQRLLVVGGNTPGADAQALDTAYWAPGASYVTEQESFSRITRISNGGFKVESKDGQIQYFGNDAGTTIAAQGRNDGQTLLWALARTEDRSGNYQIYEYIQDSGTGEYLPKQIRYGGNSNANQNTDLAVRFSYESRGDAMTMYVGGSRNDMRQRLANIQTFIDTDSSGNGGTLVRNLQLQYKESETSGRSMVVWIQASATNPITGVIEDLPKTIFNWGAGSTPSFRPLAGVTPFSLPYFIHPDSVGVWEVREPLYLKADLDGSGRTSLVAALVEGCGKYNEGSCNAPVWRPNGPTGDLKIRQPNGQEVSVTVNFASSNGVRLGRSFADRGGYVDRFGVTDIQFFDINGDGRDDILVRGGVDNLVANWWSICLNTTSVGSALSFTCDLGEWKGKPTPIELHSDRKMHLITEFNSDGIASDCHYVSASIGMQCKPIQLNGLPPTLKIAISAQERNIYASGQQEVFQPIGINFGKQSMSDLYFSWKATVPAQNPADPYSSSASVYDPITKSWSLMKADVVQGVIACFNRQDGLLCQSVYQTRSVGNNLTELSVPESVGDLNGDGLSDFIFTLSAPQQYVGRDGCWQNCSYPVGGYDGTDGTYVCLSKETGVECQRDSKSYFPRNYGGDAIASGMTTDFIGDGVDRIYLESLPFDRPTKSEVNAKAGLCRYAKDGFVCQDLPYLGRHVPDSKYPLVTKDKLDKQPIFLDNSGVPSFLLKSDSKVNGLDVWTPMTLIGAPEQDRITSVTNGMGYKEEVTYVRGDDADAYRPFALINGSEQRPMYPQIIAPAGVIAKQLRKSNGRGGTLDTNYSYQGAMFDASGRGSLGFGQFSIVDTQTQIATTSQFSQTYPTIGEVVRSATTSRDGTVLSDTTNRYNQQWFNRTNTVQTVFAYLEESNTTQKDLNQSPIKNLTSIHEYRDNWGNLTTFTETVSGAGKTFTSRSSNVYKNDASAWLIGLPTDTTITKTDSDTGSITRKNSYDYDERGLLKTQIIEPNTNLQVTVTHYRANNPFGLINKSVQAWVAPNGVQQLRTITDLDFDPKGRFAITSRNALGHQESRTYYPSTGALNTLKNPNGLISTFTANGFGRVTLEEHPDGNQTRQYQKQCNGGCPLGAELVSITDTFNGNDRIVTPTLIYRDNVGHVLRTQNWGFDGKVIVKDAVYDSLGRLFQTDQSRFEGENTYPAARYFYDDLGRVTEIQNFDEQGATLRTRIDFDGLTVVSTNPNGKATIETKNALGQLISVRDSGTTTTAPGTTNMTYDAFGNLRTTKDPNGNKVTITYDNLGRKTDLDDPDLGLTHYDLDAVGRTWKQTSPKQRAAGQSTRFEYDGLNRMTARVEMDLESHWIYDSAANGIGALAEAYTQTGSKKDYSRKQSYDNKGRLSTTLQELTDGIYQSTQEYDRWGRQSRQKYLRGVDQSKLKTYELRYNNKGYLERVERNGLVLWKTTTQDAANRTTAVALGNGLVQTKYYQPHTSRLESGELRASASGVLRFSDNYYYDKLGNVKQRKQIWDTTSFIEDFDYDDLNRLKTSTIAGISKFINYDAAGNILSKTGVGTYAYPTQGDNVNAKQPHAVRNISGVGNFDYDDNGNLKEGAGRNISWKSFDMPFRITKGGQFSEFIYGPEHQRVRQDKSGGAYIVYAGGQEVEKVGSDLIIKTYWPLGIGMEIEKNGNTTLNWLHTDRLGSPIAISDEVGNLSERLAYDPWGKRRTEDGSSTADDVDGKVDNKGFTGHEMLDQLDLVHMNGRVYDPLTARFISADPHVTDPNNGQSYNRYAYVWNNPLGYTDPTGFDNVVTHPAVIVSGSSGNYGGTLGTFFSMYSGSGSGRITDLKWANATSTDLYRNTNKYSRKNASRNCVAGSTLGGCASRTGEVPNCPQNVQCVSLSPIFNETTTDIYATPFGSGFWFYASDGGDGNLFGTFNATTENSNNLPSGTYSLSPRPHIKKKVGFSRVLQLIGTLKSGNISGDVNKHEGQPLISNIDIPGLVRDSDGSILRGITIHPGRGENGDEGQSLGCMVCNTKTYNALNSLIQKNYNNGGAFLHIAPRQ